MKKKMMTLIVVTIMVGLIPFAGEAAQAADCTVTVTAPASIQAAIDAASAGDVICLSGTFNQSVVFGSEDSGITLTSASTAILDGSGLADPGSTLDSNFAIRLDDGVSDVTIENLEIHSYLGWRGSAIQAWDVSTSNITVRNNYLYDFGWNFILVGSEGGFIHDGWTIQNNVCEDAFAYGIELTNCESCRIMKNEVDSSYIGITIQARNTISGSGNTAVDGVHVLHNTINNAVYGNYVFSFTGHPTNFTPITGASTLLSNVNVQHNTFMGDATGILFWAYNDAATAVNGRISNNEIDCPTDGAGIKVLESGKSGQIGTVENVKVVNNTVDSDCNPAYTDQGDATKLPPGLGPYGGLP